jgi:hypothetical protein
LMAPAGAEERLFQVASLWEAATKGQPLFYAGRPEGSDQ